MGRRLAEGDSSLFAEDIVRLAETEGIAAVELGTEAPQALFLDPQLVFEDATTIAVAGALCVAIDARERCRRHCRALIC